MTRLAASSSGADVSVSKKKSTKQKERGEKEGAASDGGEDESARLTLEAPPATPTNSRTEMDNITTMSIAESTGSKSSILSPSRLFRRTPKKQAHRAHEMTPAEEARAEANDLMGSRDPTWMCGVCGVLFDTSRNAANHEKACLMEWLKHDKLVRSAWRDKQESKNTSDIPQFLERESKKYLDYTKYVPPRTGGELPVSPLLQKYLLMTDEALVCIARRQRGIMHEVIDRDLCALSLKKQKAREGASQAAPDVDYTEHDKRNHEDLFLWEREYDAMRELELAARDRQYYANLEKRAMERRVGPQPHWTKQDYYYHRLRRIRTAGTDNFHMETTDSKEKEGDRKVSSVKKAVKGRLDHAYKLAKGETHRDGGDSKKQAHKNETDKGGKEMIHDNNTLFINVVVKNSIQVVNNVSIDIFTH